MKQSASPVTYIVKPPDVPMFLTSRVSNLRQLIKWSQQEHQRWLIRCAEGGYWKYLKVLNEEYSPIRFLAELHGFRRICANITKHDWDNLTGRERVFIRRAFEMRELLLG